MKNKFVHTEIKDGIFYIIWTKKTDKLSDKRFLKLMQKITKEKMINDVNCVVVDGNNLKILFDTILIEKLTKIIIQRFDKKIKYLTVFVEKTEENEFKRIGIEDFFEQIMEKIQIKTKLFCTKEASLDWIKEKIKNNERI